MIRYTINESGDALIKGHLIACDEAYVPRLSDRVDLDHYASKLHQLATRYEAWQDERLIGLVAAYFGAGNEPEIFVSNVSVDPSLTGRGIGTSLLARLIADARLRHCGSIRLEVSPQNLAAQKFYSKFGFVVLADGEDEPASMVLSLREKKL
ncbi:GNAT family N-acetyltransferase [Opitutus sp. GAS368]|uniref:GNAT family N-acetyltransferase n=1 Tax=Opitutus sp. GAS368 TaxID=1882749 RepID=UPI00087DA532|nr:GNAT family N-acetyltransferase [Opitutus sp. GAS368]SDS27458.1 ribosomal-protein-alanine N-acetyltransferase [Opitutus sp. GAS368]